MDLLKAALFALMASTLVVMWLNRGYVINSYVIDDEAPTEIRLNGLALDFEKTELPASPYVVHIGEDTRRRPMALLFTETEDRSVPAMTGGKTKIEGSVIVDGEPAVGGTVRLERQTVDGIGSRDVPINGFGYFAARDLPGGRYRVRAWLPGTATMTTSDLFFAEAGSTYTRSYSLEAVQSDPIIEFASGGPMYVGLSGSFGASVTQHRVDNEGIVVTRPVAGAYVSTSFSDYVELLSPDSQATNEQGLVVFRLRCRRPGQGTVTVTFADEIIVVPLPGCMAIPETTLPPATVPTDGTDAGDGSGGATTTTSVTNSGSTQSTTRTGTASTSRTDSGNTGGGNTGDAGNGGGGGSGGG